MIILFIAKSYVLGRHLDITLASLFNP